MPSCSVAADERTQLTRRVEHLRAFLTREKAAREAADAAQREATDRSALLAAQLESARQQLTHGHQLLKEAHAQYSHYVEAGKKVNGHDTTPSMGSKSGRSLIGVDGVNHAQIQLCVNREFLKHQSLNCTWSRKHSVGCSSNNERVGWFP